MPNDVDMAESPNSGGVPKPTGLRYRRPGIPRDALRRRRLDDLLDRLFRESPTVFVGAASGAGKTVQAQLYAERAGLPVAWLTLDSSHSSPQRLLTGLMESLERYVAPDGHEATRTSFHLETSVAEATAAAAGTILRQPALLVVDECEHLAGSEEAGSALAVFLRYCPDTLRVLLLSSADTPRSLQQLVLDGSVRLVGDEDLLLTEEESRRLGDLIPAETDDVIRVRSASGGWMAGVVFGLRYGLHEHSTSNDLPSSIMTEVLSRLDADERQFLTDTSIPDALTREAAVALTGGDGHRLWDALRSRHLPATTTTDSTIVYHSLFRSFLRRQSLSTDPERHTEMVRRYARHLMSRGHAEEATEYFLSIEEFDAAIESFEPAVGRLCDRSDWSTLLRWADRLGHERLYSSPVLVAGLVRALFGERRFEECVRLIRRLDRSGRLRGAMEADAALLATAAWALQSDAAESRRLLDRYPGDYRADVVRFMLEVSSDVDPAVPPLGTDWDDVERIMSWGLFLQGRLSELRKFLPKDPNAPVLNPNVILPAILDGHWHEARDLLARVPPEIRDRPQTHFIESALLLTEGSPELAEATLAPAINDSRKTSFFMSSAYEAFYAYILFRLGRGGESLAALRRSIEENAGSGHTAIVEWSQGWLGAILLTEGKVEEARQILAECVHSMKRAHRRLFLPFAAAALSEAEARSGDQEAAHQAAQLSYHSAAMMGYLSALLPALHLFPAIAVREDRRDPVTARWRRLVVAPSARVSPRSLEKGLVHIGLQPFGTDRDLIVNGEPQGIGRLKIIELTGLLVLRPHGIERTQLQAELFPDATVRNGGNHFRQISFKFRQITGIALDRRTGNLVGLPSDTIIEAADIRFEELTRASSLVPDEERVHRLRSALSLVCGSYLQDSNLAWAEERRGHLAVVEEEARLELASLLLELGRPEAARAEVEHLLALNRYSDPGYRVLVRIERSIGSESSVLAAYRRAVVALDELGLQPGDARRLLESPARTR